MTFSYNSYEQFREAYKIFLNALMNHQPWNNVDISAYTSWKTKPDENGGVSYIILGIKNNEETS